MTYWIGCIDFGEPVEVLLSVRHQVLLLGTHAEQRLWKHTYIRGEQKIRSTVHFKGRRCELTFSKYSRKK